MTAFQDCCAHAQCCCLCCSLCSSPLSITSALHILSLCTGSVTTELCCPKDVERCYLLNRNKRTLHPCTCNNFFASAYSYAVQSKLQEQHPKMVWKKVCWIYRNMLQSYVNTLDIASSVMLIVNNLGILSSATFQMLERLGLILNL